MTGSSSKQRLAIALCLIEKPDFLVLDEPTNGVDAEGIISIRNLLKELNTTSNVTMLISSHNLHELYNLATSFCFLKDGVVKEISKKDEISRVIDSSLIISSDNNDLLIKFLKTTDFSIVYKKIGDDIHVFNIENIENFKAFLRTREGVTLQIKSYDIEDYFLRTMEVNDEKLY